MPPSSASYREIGPLASGGMAELFEAERDDGTAVVIKRIRPAFVFDDTYRALFYDEGQVQHCLCHPNVVTLLDRGEDDRGPYLVFERVFGTDLGIVLEAAFENEQPLEIAQVLAVFIPLFDALACVHEACADDGECLNVIHRDISPGNILLSEGGEVKLADFGVAKSTLKTQHTVVGEMKGKFAYMAPEQTRGEEVGPKADLFAAGVVLYECLTAKRLFDGPCDVDVVQAVRAQDACPPSAENPDVPPELCALVQRLLEKEPELRPQTAEAVADELRDIALNLCLDSGHRRQVSRLARAHPREAQVADAEGDHRRKTQRVMGAVPAAPVVVRQERPRRPLLVAAAAGAALLVVTGFALFGDGGDDAADVDVTAPSAKRFAPLDTAPAPAATVAPPTVTSTKKAPDAPRVSAPSNGVDTGEAPSTTKAPLPKKAKRAATPASSAPSAAKKGVSPAETVAKKEPKPAPVKPLKTSARRTKVVQPVAAKGAAKKVAMVEPAPVKPEGFGRLFLAAEPWARVYVDGALLSTTPVNGARLTAGKHTVDIENPVYKIKKRLVIDVPKDGEVRRFVDLTRR